LILDGLRMVRLIKKLDDIQDLLRRLYFHCPRFQRLNLFCVEAASPKLGFDLLNLIDALAQHKVHEIIGVWDWQLDLLCLQDQIDELVVELV